MKPSYFIKLKLILPAKFWFSHYSKTPVIKRFIIYHFHLDKETCTKMKKIYFSKSRKCVTRQFTNSKVD